jgi:hypothetical protein
MKPNSEANIPNSTLQKYLITTIYASLIIQIVTGTLDLYVVFTAPESSDPFLKKLLWVELIVQAIEGTFYVWLATSAHSISNITPNRYFDWAFSTPTMLFTFISYLIHLQSPQTSLYQVFQNNASVILSSIGLNAAMLIFGYLGEIKILTEPTAVFLGFIPFIIYFSMIYYYYVLYSEKSTIIFWLFSGIWLLYGVAALAPYYIKNISYNILDLFSKNFFGLFLAYLVAVAA